MSESSLVSAAGLFLSKFLLISNWLITDIMPGVYILYSSTFWLVKIWGNFINTLLLGLLLNFGDNRDPCIKLKIGVVHYIFQVSLELNVTASRCSSRIRPAKTFSCRSVMWARSLQSNIWMPFPFARNMTSARTHDKSLGFLLPLAAAGLKIQVKVCNETINFNSCKMLGVDGTFKLFHIRGFFFRSLLKLSSVWWKLACGLIQYIMICHCSSGGWNAD